MTREVATPSKGDPLLKAARDGWPVTIRLVVLLVAKHSVLTASGITVMLTAVNRIWGG